MKNKKVVGLSDKEKEIIQQLNHPEFSVEFIDDWLRNPPKKIEGDVMATSVHHRIEGYMAAVNRLKAIRKDNI